MNPQFKLQHRQLDVEGVEHHIITVRYEKEAIQVVKQLADKKFDSIEVCGAFGEASAKRLYEASDKRVPIGYVIYPEEQLEALAAFWET